MPAEMLTRMLDTKGVRYAALIGPAGEVLDNAGVNLPDTGFVQAARAVGQSLSATVGGHELQDLLVDLAGGPVLLTPHQLNLLVVGFDEVGNLGRVRFAVRREISKL
ncbi:roadblock/LC7 domain-containing protein [Deinococcus sp.]|uniref:roadblock/LC7 domain-containing protein n=1 Tax=Deinococcus sp. TaxID=47478 RepID=UPI0025FAE599|nr:roadblock/LC7 domain-containing protein [Deinococcus sp.]